MFSGLARSNVTTASPGQRGVFVVVFVVLAGVSLLLFGIGAWNFYGYQIGTPTTATVTYCGKGRGATARPHGTSAERHTTARSRDSTDSATIRSDHRWMFT